MEIIALSNHNTNWNEPHEGKSSGPDTSRVYNSGCWQKEQTP
jgi:hypothetical protein